MAKTEVSAKGASCMPSSHNSCNKFDASDVRASRKLACTVARERRTFSARDLCQAHSPRRGECAGPNLLTENVKRSRAKVRTSLADVRRRPLETPRGSQGSTFESSRGALGTAFVLSMLRKLTVWMAAPRSTAEPSGAALPRASRTSAEGHCVRGSSCWCRASVRF